MKKRIISVSVVLIMLLQTTTLVYAENEIFINEVFDNYPTNSTETEKISATSGIDTRVKEDGKGNKAFYGKAWGEKVKIKSTFTGSEKTVFSADIKICGNVAPASVFSLTCGTETLTLLNITEQKRLKLYDGKDIGGITYDTWTTLTAVADFKSGLLSVYANGKCLISNWYLSKKNYTAPSEVRWELSAPGEGFSELYIDNIRIYEGERLPKDMYFEAKSYSSETEDFTPTEKIEELTKVFLTNDYSGSAAGMTFINQGGIQFGKVTLDDGNDVISAKADGSVNGDSYFDTTCNELATENKYVIEADVFVNRIEGTSEIDLFDAKDTYGKWRFGIRFTADGRIAMRETGVQIGTYIPGEWTTVSMCYNVSSGTVDTYINKKLTRKALPAPDSIYPVIYRIDAVVRGGSPLEFYIDNFRIYQGNAPRIIKEEQNVESTALKSVMENENDAKSLIGSASIFMLSNETMFLNGEKSSYKTANNKPYVEDGVFMVPLPMLDKVIKSASIWNEAAGEAIIGGKVHVYAGSDTMQADEKKITMPKAANVRNGVLYVPLRAVCKDGLSKTVAWDERGFMIISNGPFKYKDSENFYQLFDPIDKIYRYMQFERPAGKEITENIKTLNPDHKHPRLLYTDERVSQMKTKISEIDEMKSVYDKISAQADIYESADVTKYIDGSAVDGVKQTQSWNLYVAVEILGTKYVITGDEKYAAAITRYMDEACKWDTLGENTSLLASGHWTFGMGLGYDTVYNYLNATESGREKLKFYRDTIYRVAYKGVVAAYSSGNGRRWINIRDNFAAVIGGGHLMMLLALADEDDNIKETEFLLENVLKTLEIPVSLYAPDGAWYEGPSYWVYTNEFMSVTVDCMLNSCGTDYGFSDVPGFKTAGYAMLYAATPNGLFNYHDSAETFQNDVASYFYADRFNDAVLGKQWHNMYNLSYKNSPNVFNKRSLLWYKPEWSDTKNAEIPLDKYFKTAEFGTMRDEWGTTTPTFVGIHGGRTSLPHDMLDVGEFVFEADGVRWAKDLGNDNYGLKGYWTNDGYNIYRKRTEGENCLVINPRGDYYGQELESGAKLLMFKSSPRSAMAAYDLSDIYKSDAESVKRGYYFGDDRNSLTVRDEITLKKDDSEIYWFMHTPASIGINGNEAVLNYAGKQCLVSVICNADEWEILDMDPKPFEHVPSVEGQAVNTGRKLAIRAKGSGKINITVKLSPINDKYNLTPADNTPISNWVLLEGESEKRLTASEISADGEKILDFSPNIRSYTVTIPVDAKEPPLITAKSDEGTITVENADSIFGTTRVYVSAEGRKTQSYSINFKIDTQREINVSDEMTGAKPQIGFIGSALPHKTIFASNIPEAVNGPDNLYDRNLETRWATSLDGAFVEYDFGTVQDIDGIFYAIYEGTARKNNFEILYSENGIDYKKVYSGQSSGKTAEYERLEIPGRTRFIRCVAHGADVTNWFSLLEFGAYKK